MYMIQMNQLLIVPVKYKCFKFVIVHVPNIIKWNHTIEYRDK